MDGVFEDEIDCKRILREICILNNLRHKYIVELIDIIEPKDKKHFDSLYVVLELVESDIRKVVKSAINLDMKQITHLIYNMLCAVNYMHSADVLHRDLKPANMLVNEACEVKLCDFGLARCIKDIKVGEDLVFGNRKQ